jgi:hypothetical protein
LLKKRTFSNFKSITLSVYTERITYLFFAEKRFQPFITLNLPIEVYSAAASQGRGAPYAMFEPRLQAIDFQEESTERFNNEKRTSRLASMLIKLI